MFARFRRARLDPAIPATLYGAIVAQARETALYAELGVPDTVEGRFEMVVAHTGLVLRRLGNGDEAARAVGQAVFDVFCDEMDDALRSLGVKDTSVGKRMRRLAEAYYGRTEAYDAALAAGDAGRLASTLRRTVYEGGDEVAAAALAAYMLDADRALAATPLERVIAGKIGWPAIVTPPQAAENQP
ncbi:MAG TPA: ubiquinol-cytochrome C chaperone family protein [Bauldia sp.]|nr:ubiquinol-cytochrome C chaperone family protein [Bauldia sp.]